MNNKVMRKRPFDTICLSTAYFPPIEYFIALANADNCILEGCENFQKQTYRTRCHIYGASGVLSLAVPVKRGVPSDFCSDDASIPVNREGKTHRIPIRRISIDYSKPWIIQHERAIESAYSTSPYYEYYRDYIFREMESQHEFLFDMNLNLIKVICRLIDLHTDIKISGEFACILPDGMVDLRNVISPKYKGESFMSFMKMEKPYYQVFSDRKGFLSDLSILDLLFNEGPNSISFLR